VLLLAAIAGILTVSATVQWALSVLDSRRFCAPGTFVNGLHVYQLGAGNPAIVFESGLGASCLSWRIVQSQLAASMATYSYDRAGFGWSSPDRSGRCLLERRAEDLHTLLRALDVPKPYVLVAHSFGAYIVSFHAHHHPEEIAGIVLVDPLTPEEWVNPTAAQRWRLRRVAFLNRFAGVLAFVGVARFGLWLLLRRRDESPGPLSRHIETLRRIRSELKKFPPEVVPFIRAHWSRSRFYWAMAANVRDLAACAKSVAQCSIPPHLPVTVLSGAQQPPERLAEQAALANASQQGHHIVCAQSAHYIHLDEPGLITAAVQEMIERTAGQIAVSK